MLAKIRLDGTDSLLHIARFCGCAPCQILAVNDVRTEPELLERYSGKDIDVPVLIKCLMRDARAKLSAD